MLPLICSGDQRKATQLQVREHTTVGFKCVKTLFSAHFGLHQAINLCILTLREKMAQAYDFALDKIGMEIMSYQVHVLTVSTAERS